VRLHRQLRDPLTVEVNAHVLIASDAVSELLDAELVWRVELPGPSSLQCQDREMVDERADGKRGFGYPSLCCRRCEPFPERAGRDPGTLDRFVPLLKTRAKLREVRQERLEVRLLAAGRVGIVAAALELDGRAQQVAQSVQVFLVSGVNRTGGLAARVVAGGRRA
jgi:hypothetical protein